MTFLCQKPLPTLPYTMFRFILEFRAILKEYAHQSRHATLDSHERLSMS